MFRIFSQRRLPSYVPGLGLATAAGCAAFIAACSSGAGDTPASGGGPAGGSSSSVAGGGASSTAGTNATAGTTSMSGGAAGTASSGGTAAGGKTSGGAGGGNGGSVGVGGSGNASGGSSGSGGSGGGSGGSAAVTCPTTALAPGNTDRMLSFGGSNRAYTLHVPSGYDGSKAVPLVIDFHGLSGNGKGESSSSPYPAQTDADGVIMAFPSGLSGPGGTAWNVGPCCVKNTDDVAFAKALVAEVEKSACIDTKRVYAVGFSMGGGMSHYLACHAADTFAAVAPAAFDLLQENIDDCKPTRPISVISFRSTGDNVVDYDGGYSMAVQGMPINFLGAKATFQKWAEINQCTGAASAEDSNGCATYAGCPGGVEVTLCTKQGGTHEPGNAKVGWPSLKKHVLP